MSKHIHIMPRGVGRIAQISKNLAYDRYEFKRAHKYELELMGMWPISKRNSRIRKIGKIILVIPKKRYDGSFIVVFFHNKTRILLYANMDERFFKHWGKYLREHVENI